MCARVWGPTTTKRTRCGNMQWFQFSADASGCRMVRDTGCWQTRNHDMFLLVKTVWEVAVAPSFPKDAAPLEAWVYTGDTSPPPEAVPPGAKWFCMAGTAADAAAGRLLPSFVFLRWRQVGIADYESKRRAVSAAAEMRHWQDPRLFWRGSSMTEVTWAPSPAARAAYVAFSEAHPLLADCKFIKLGGESIGTVGGDQSALTEGFVFLEAHSRYRVLLDGMPNGYSGRLPFLLATGRPVILHLRRFEQWYFYGKDALTPWVHFIPMNSVEELPVLVRWTFDHSEKAAEIGVAGKRFAERHLTAGAASAVMAAALLASVG